MLNTNPVAKLDHHTKILRKLRLNVSKRMILAIFVTIMSKVILFYYNDAIYYNLKCYLLLKILIGEIFVDTKISYLSAILNPPFRILNF